ncbi:hypothetical protein SR1949_06220 [Sphaerospermopsis reniformis]|uniref:Uncharacterized protein n=1 Tax=Sphaerospermopsis reniformis TaxID=531300 RepID=A0A479ZVB2_9CYAN|nr:hypothetical protein SR1949_06220 [Sphaerospermopsis reniformis]
MLQGVPKAHTIYITPNQFVGWVERQRNPSQFLVCWVSLRQVDPRLHPLTQPYLLLNTYFFKI